ncbi:MAG TPA: thymidylate synthase [Nitrososphaera sp.]
MTHTLGGRNVNIILQECCWWLEITGIKEGSRNGPVRVAREPVIVEYYHPTERVLLWPERKANPFFHLFEALWMLAGHDDVEYVAKFNPRMKEFSDDGMSLHGAYGARWWLQLPRVVEMLKKDPTTRRAVIGIWDPAKDLWTESKDLPCNTQIYFRVVEGRLRMTVCNRSNDLIWGMCGSNAVHFSMLQELIAWGAGLLVGSYFQFTNNLHIYDNVPKREIYSKPFFDDPYSEKGGVEPFPMCSIPFYDWLQECKLFIREPNSKFKDPFFEHVCKPMMQAWEEKSPEPLKKCIADDWKRAGMLFFASKSNLTMLA